MVGKSVPRFDVADKVFGTLPYVTDVRLPGMLHARVIRPPVAGSVPVSVDEASIKGIPGAQVVRKGDFIAVLAPKEWDAVKASRQVKVTWSEVKNPFPDFWRLPGYLRSATAAKVKRTLGFQVPFAERVRREADIPTMAVGLILEPHQAEQVLRSGQADLIAIGRQALFNPNWALHAQIAMGIDPDFAAWPVQYGWWLTRRQRSLSQADADAEVRVAGMS